MRHVFMAGMTAFAIFLVAMTGCQPQKPTPSYTGSIKVVRVNGEVTQVEVSLPGQTITLTNREDANRLITQMEAMTTELKAGRDQFKVQEPAVATPPGK
jgi:hypothetical protein